MSTFLNHSVYGRALLVFPGWLCLSAAAFAQNAQIAGIVTDPEGRPVANASVVLLQEGTNLKRQAQTNSSGEYAAPFLPDGSYQIRIAVTGFAPAEQEHIALQTGQQARVDFQLKVGSAADAVTVSASGSGLQTETSSVQTVIDRQFAASLPLNGRSFDTLFLLTPGVTPSPTNNQGSYAVNGQRTEGNQYYIDGVSANIAGSNTAANRSGGVLGLGGTSSTSGTNALLSTDALQEFQVQTGSYAPEYGRTPGGQFDITSRAGTNQWHGTAYDYLRNDALDANNWINDNLAIPRQPERQNDFGGVFGGPIRRDRTFFFFSYEGLRLVQPETFVTSVPSAATRAAAPAAVQPILSLFPQTTGTDIPGTGLANYNSVSSSPSHIDATALRIDHQFGDKLRLFARYDHAPSSGTNPNGITQQARQYRLETFTAGLTYVPRANLTNELRYNYSLSAATTQELLPPDADQNANFAAFLPGFTPARGYIQDELSFGGQFSYVVWGLNSGNTQTQWNVVDKLALVEGKHQLGFGVDYRQITSDRLGFPGLVTYLFTSLNDLLADRISSSSFSASAASVYRLPVLGLYAEDTWRVRPQLVLTYGARWDYGGAPDFISGPTPLSVININNPAAAPAGTALFQPPHQNIAPRVGLTYTSHGNTNSATVVRGGFGIFYDVQGSTENAVSLGNTASTLPVAGLSFPLTPAQAAVPNPAAPTAPYANQEIVDPNLRSPRTYQWSVAVEQQLGRDQSFSATYIGSGGRQLLRTLVQPNVNATFLGATTELTNFGSSNYQALQAKYNRRLSRGLQVLSSYTWAHSIDNGSSYEYSTGPIPNYNPFRDRGPSDYDIRNTFSLGGHYAAPLLRGANPFVRETLGGWSFDPLIFIESAPPVDPSLVVTVQGERTTLRPDRVPGVPLTIPSPGAPRGFILNPAALSDFTTAYTATTPLSAVRQGTLGRNAFRGYNLVEPDLSIARTFPIREQLHLLFRTDAFNVVNHPDFAQPNTQFNAPNFGITQSTVIGNATNTFGNLIPIYHTGNPRSLQIALKLEF